MYGVAGEEKSDMSRKSMFFVSLPKSGTVFTWHSLAAVTGLKIPDFGGLPGWQEYTIGRDYSCPELYASGDYNTQLLRPENMQRFAEGFIFGAHMQASYHNTLVLGEAGIERITVLLRDPRDAFVSWVYHLRQLGPSARDYHSKIYHIPRAYYDWTPARQVSYQVRTFLPVIINWVEGWLDYYAAPERKLDVLFVYYDELKRDPRRYTRRIVEFHGLEGADYDKIPVAEPGKLHFRKGEHEQWRTELSMHERGLADDLMQERLIDSFERAGESHEGWISAQSHFQQGEHRSAAAGAVRTIAQFPNFMPAYELLLGAASACNVPNQTVGNLVLKLDRSTEGQFRYHSALVDACTELASALQD